MAKKQPRPQQKDGQNQHPTNNNVTTSYPYPIPPNAARIIGSSTAYGLGASLGGSEKPVQSKH